MNKTILCKKLGKELPALSIPPMPGPKGIEILENISAEAWEMWKSHQTTLINDCLLYTSPSPRDRSLSRMPSSA